jgi:hypothetical protein
MVYYAECYYHLLEHTVHTHPFISLHTAVTVPLVRRHQSVSVSGYKGPQSNRENNHGRTLQL